MKIVEVCPYDMGRPGGVQSHIRDLSAWLRRQGHEVRIVAPSRLNGEPVEGVECIGKSRRITVHGTLTEICYVPRREAAAMVADLRGWGADILHLHTPWTPLLPWQIWRGSKLPAAATFHATLPGANTGGLLGKAMRAAATYYVRRLDATIVPSTSPLSYLKTLPGVTPPVILPPSVDLSAWAEAAKTGRKAGTATARNIVFLGRLEHRKGVDVLLGAWEQLSSRLPDTALTIAGGGEMEHLVRAAMAKPAGASIRYVPEPSGVEARRLVADADIFVAPSLFGESFGIVLIEAMAAGAVPVAAANSGYSTVMTGPGETLLTAPGDANALAQRIEWLALDGDARARLREWGHAHAMGYDIASIGPGYEAVFKDVLRRRAERSR